MSEINKLILKAGTPILQEANVPGDFKEQNPLFRELGKLLEQKNGFYAFESALLVRPWGNSEFPLDLLNWNKKTGWISRYKLDLPELFFFAEDVFGGQFAIAKNEIVSFDPETGEITHLGNNLEDWACLLMNDYDCLTGYSIAHSWQVQNGPLKKGMRLVPKKLFVLGGEFESVNLSEEEEVRAMKLRGDFASKLADLPDGTQVEFRVIE